MIVKFCRKDHNCLKGSKLLIGNLEKYRTIEDAALRDEGEGTFDFSIELFEGVKVPSAWANLIFGGSIGFGSGTALRVPSSFNAYIDRCDIEYVADDIVSFRYASAKISYKAMNTFVFCTSQVEGDPMQNCPFPEYDDNWRVGINKSDLDSFSARVGNLLLQQLTEKNFTNKLRNLSLSELKRLGINIQHGPVKYVDRYLKITQQKSGQFEEIMQTYLSTAFTKPKEPFSKEREYRFLFSPYVDNQLLEASSDDVLLDINALTSRH